VAAYCLDIHSGYRCRHSGACCESWTVPAEREVVELVRTRGVTLDRGSGPFFLSSTNSDETETWTVARTNAGDCVFFERNAGRLCAIHRELGEAALPSACRHFPRRVLHDARGTLISLSHFCPTAASTLQGGGTLSIVDAHAPLLLGSTMEGLDARDALPPLVRPGLLCDMAGYDAWERAGITRFADPDVGYERCLAELIEATELIRDWRPGAESMTDSVRAAFNQARRGYREGERRDHGLVDRVASLTVGSTSGEFVAIPAFEEEWARRIGIPGGWFDREMKRYLAARLFGNWIAYQGRGLRSIVEWLRTCAAVVRHFAVRRLTDSEQPFEEPVFIEAVRSADLLLLHVLDSTAFARAIVAIEETDYP
jgi:Fe-S-cluster containining protein